MSRLWPLICVLAAIVTACGTEDTAAELERLIEETELAAEERDTGYFRSLISERYFDSQGNDRERMIDVIRGYFFTNQSIEVVMRVKSIALIGAGTAEVSLLAGILSQRAGATLLNGLDGRLYDVELEFVLDGRDWQVIGARWERSLEAWGAD